MIEGNEKENGESNDSTGEKCVLQPLNNREKKPTSKKKPSTHRHKSQSKNTKEIEEDLLFCTSKKGNASIKDLSQEEKQKIGVLIKKVADERREKENLIIEFEKERGELKNSIKNLTEKYEVIIK